MSTDRAALTKVGQSTLFGCKKLKPGFNWLSRFIVFKAIEEGVSSLGLVVMGVSLLIVIVNIPNLLGLQYSSGFSHVIQRFWTLSLGVVAIFLAGTTARAMGELLNNHLASHRQIDTTSLMLGSMISYLFVVTLQADTNTISFSLSELGMSGILLSLIVGVISAYCCYPFLKYFNWKWGKQIPGSFFYKWRMVAGLMLSFVLASVVGWTINEYCFVSLNTMIDTHFSVYFRTNADQWWGLAIVYGGYALSWFCGIHGPSALSFLSNPINLANDYENQQIFVQHLPAPYHIMTWGTDNFVGCFGGTGATFVLPFLLMWLVKNKEIRRTGKMSAVATVFGANEPLLFGVPMVMNLCFLVPMIIAPIANAFLFKVFVSYWGMRGFVTPLNWTIPGPIGIFVGTAFDLKALVLIAGLLILDVVIYAPFVLWFAHHNPEPVLESQPVDESTMVDLSTYKGCRINLLIICAGGATSGALAAQIRDYGAEHYAINIEGSGSAWGNHKALLSKADVVILAPQVANNLDILEGQVQALDHPCALIAPSGKEYIQLSHDLEGALNLILLNYQSLVK